VEVKKEKEETNKNELNMNEDEEMKLPRRRWSQCRRTNKDINKYIRQITEVKM
jgi:hypothetical protein